MHLQIKSMELISVQKSLKSSFYFSDAIKLNYDITLAVAI